MKKIDKKLLMYIAIAVCAVAVIVTCVLLITRNSCKYELNEKGDGYVITDYNGWAKNVTLREKRRGLPVVAIGQGAFADNKRIKSVTLPSNIKTLEYQAFYGCVNLKVVKFNEGIEDIGTDAFGECTSLTEINVPEGLKILRGAAFQNCTALQSVKLPASLESINYVAFLGCTELNEITVAEGGEYFYTKNNCLIEKATGTLIVGTNRSVIPTDGSVKAIGNGAFHDRIRLVSIVIPESVKAIGNSAFYGCQSLRTIEILGAETIGQRVFSGCTRLTTLVIGEDLESVDEGAFAKCQSLEGVYFLGDLDGFNKISFKDATSPVLSAKLYLYSEEKPTEEGNFWHYDSNSKIAIWS